MEDDGFKICPFCKEKIRKEAVKCRFCGEWLEQPLQSQQAEKPMLNSSAGVESNSAQPPDVTTLNQAAPNLSGEQSIVDDASVPPPLPTEALLDSRYKRYGGWLALFCVIQIIIQPLFIIITSLVALSQMSEVARFYPRFTFLVIFEGVLNIGVAVFGVYVGIMLRRMRNGAVGIAKQYLLTSLACAFLSCWLPFIVGSLSHPD